MQVLDTKGSTTPEFRAAVLAETIRQIAQNPMPVRALAVETAVQAALAVSEENSAREIHSALFLLARSGLIHSSGYRLDGGSESHTIGANTTITASGQLLQFIWDEQTSISVDE